MSVFRLFIAFLAGVITVAVVLSWWLLYLFPIDTRSHIWWLYETERVLQETGFSRCSRHYWEVIFCLKPPADPKPIPVNLVWDTKVRTISGAAYTYRFGEMDFFTGGHISENSSLSSPEKDRLILQVLSNTGLIAWLSTCGYTFRQLGNWKWNEYSDMRYEFDPTEIDIEKYLFVNRISNRKVFNTRGFQSLQTQLFGENWEWYSDTVACLKKADVWWTIEKLREPLQKLLLET